MEIEDGADQEQNRGCGESRKFNTLKKQTEQKAAVRIGSRDAGETTTLRSERELVMPMCIYCDGYVPNEVATDPQGQCERCGGSDFLDVEGTDEETTDSSP